MSESKQLLLCKAVFAIAAINFISFLCISVYLGGDAGNGMTHGGQYYLGSHGIFTKVSGPVFTYSKWHSYSIWVTHFSAFFAFAWHASIKSRNGSLF